MIQNLTVAKQWANTVCHKPHCRVLRAWHDAPGDEAILPCLYMCIQNTDLHIHTYKPSSTLIWDSPLSKNWSVMPRCSPGPSLLLVSGRPKAFKCFKLIITLMLGSPSPPHPLVSFVFVCKKMKCNWNRCKDGVCSDIPGVAGDLASVKALAKGNREQTGSQDVFCGDRESYREWQCTKLLTHTGAQNTSGSLFCPLLFLHFSLLCCLWCFYFWKHGNWKKKKITDPLPQCIAGNSKHTNKNSPQPPSHSPLILSCPNCGCSHPRFSSWGRYDAERSRV